MPPSWRGFTVLLSKLTSESGKRRSGRVDWKECDVHRLLVSFWSSMGYVGLGAVVIVFGPTILDLADELDVGIGILSAMLVCRAAGAAIGSVGAGIALDKLLNWSYLFMAVVVLASIATTVVLPVSVNVYMLAVFMFLNGIATGAFDSGTHAVLFRLWKDNAGPCMQVLHFAFGFGAFVAPLIAKQFISEERDLSNSTSATTDQTGSGIWAETGSGYFNNESAQENGNFRIAYWISSAIFIPTLLAYAVYAVKYDIAKCVRGKRLSPDMGSGDSPEESMLREELDGQEPGVGALSPADYAETLQNASHSESSPTTLAPNGRRAPEPISGAKKRQSPLFKFLIVSLLGLFMLVYVGLEAGYGGWIFTVVVTGPLSFSKSQGTVIQSLFWGTFAFARLFSVLLAVANVKPGIMMAGNLTGSMIAAVIMVSFPHNAAAIWLASAVLGMSYASIYPTAMTWMSQTIEVTGTGTSILITGGIVGDIVIPAAMGGLISNVSPDAIFYMTFVGVIISAGLVVVLLSLAYAKRRKEATAMAAQQSSLSRESARNHTINLVNMEYRGRHVHSEDHEEMQLMDHEGGSDEESTFI